MRTSRSGFALVLSIVLILALVVSAAGMLAVATREAAVSTGLAGRLRAERMAEAAARDAVVHWSTRAVADLRPEEQKVLIDSGGVRVTTERADSSLYLLRSRGRARVAHGVAIAHSALLVRVLNPARLARAFPAALAADGAVEVLGGSVTGAGESTALPCDSAGPGVVAPGVSVTGTAAVDGAPAVVIGSPPAVPDPDPFSPALAETVADVRYRGSVVSPRPIQSQGECSPDPENWGTTDPADPCHELLPVVLTGTVTVDGGVARGVIVTDGDLTLTGAARIQGVVIVAGAIIRDGCAVGASLSAPSLDRAFRPPGRWWIPAF